MTNALSQEPEAANTPLGLCVPSPPHQTYAQSITVICIDGVIRWGVREPSNFPAVNWEGEYQATEAPGLGLLTSQALQEVIGLSWDFGNLLC